MYKRTKIEYKGKLLPPVQLFKQLSKDYDIPEDVLKSRFYKHGMDWTKIVFKKSSSKHSPEKKQILAKINDEKILF